MDNLLTLLQGLGIEPRRASVADGGEYHSGCPSCGDGGKGRDSDRFHIWPEKLTKSTLCVGRFWCRQCGIAGDTIEFLMKFYRMSFKAACDQLGIRLESGVGKSYSRPATPTPPRQETFVPKIYQQPSRLWSQRAANFLTDCQQRLQTNDEALAWLATRGISREAAVEYGLGYNESSSGGDRYRPRARWGLADKKGASGKTVTKLWLPRGLVIPMIGDDGAVLQLRIRRRDEDIATFANDIKYLPVDGSCHGTMILHPDAEAFVVVECGFDAILIASLFGGRMGAVTTWNASARPDATATRILHRCQCILNCLDFDEAGANEARWWIEQFRRVVRWPTPRGKDPGEAFAAGVDIRKWILGGLPKGLADRIVEIGKQPIGKTTVELESEALPVVDWLKWCPICWGDQFFEAASGGYFCVKCQPVDRPGKVVKAGSARGEHEVI